MDMVTKVNVGSETHVVLNTIKKPDPVESP